MSETEVLRRFNRTYTQRIGALDESFLGLGLPLGSARLLFEIGYAGASVRELRARLGLDSGYLARLLRRLEDDRLVALAADPSDRRRRLVTLTRQGAATWKRLDDRSEQLAGRLVAPLTPRQRARLTEALRTADLLVRAATVQLQPVAPGSADAVQAVGHYFAELEARFPGGFDSAAALAEEAATPGEPGTVFVVARSDGEPVACGGIRTLAPGVGEIKRMWVHPEWRGAGLGARLLRHLEEEGARLSHGVIRLDTNESLTEAVAMYERSGYQRIGRYNDNPYAEAWFEKTLAPGGRAEVRAG